MNGNKILSPEEQHRLKTFFSSRRIPARIEWAIENYILKKTGRPYSDPVILERLRRAIITQKSDYWKAPQKRRLAYTKGYSVLGYLAYQFPVYFMQTEYLMQTLARSGLLLRDISVLDIGTGPGVVPLAIADFLSRLDGMHAVIHSIEISEEHREAFRYLRDAAGPGSREVVIRDPLPADIRTLAGDEMPGPVNLMVFSNVINEFEDLPVEELADLVLKFTGRLVADGTLLIAEPAEEITATRLRVLSRILQDRGLTIHSPCPVLRKTRCDPSRCWSFATQPDILPTQLMEALAACNEPYRYLNTDIKYAYVIVRKDNRTQNQYRIPHHAKVAWFAKLHLHVGRRIAVTAAKISQDLGDNKTHVVRICDGTPAKPVYAVLPEYHRNANNSTLLSSPYGEILMFGDVLVRYNKKHDAYNLLVTKRSRVQEVSRQLPSTSLT